MLETNFNKFKDEIVYQTKDSYNGLTINAGNWKDNTKLYIAKTGLSEIYMALAFYSAYLFDRSLDEQEIKAFIRKYIDPEYLLPSEIPTPDCYYDLSQGSNDDETRETIKDYSGNGNDAVAHGFSWSGMSGYSGYNIQSWSTYGTISVINDSYNKVTITKSPDPFDDNPVYYNIPTNVSDFTIKVSDKDAVLNFMDVALTVINKGNGEWFIPKNENQATTRLSITSTLSELTLEQTPLYKGALVFDGVDDYVSLDAFDSGFKTVFMVFKFFNLDKMIYDQRKNTGTSNDFAIYTQNSLAYSARNKYQTFINGKLNTRVITANITNKKHLVHIISETNPQITPKIGENASIGGFNGKMALYKFLGFKEVLTEGQIQYVIKKYNLLDGVDEIEVS